MFETLEQLPPDPILGLSAEFKADPNPNKVNLGVGVYKTETGETPIFGALKEAEARLIAAQTTKGYIGQEGDPTFLAEVSKLVLGDDLYAELGANTDNSKVSGVMTPGGSGALRMIAGLIMRTSIGGSQPTVWATSPTWGNHFPLLESAGLKLDSYSYYDAEAGLVDFDAMMAGLGSAKAGDVVLAHACCHNPTGADLSNDQWDTLIDHCADKQLVLFIDMAYQGLAQGLDEDAYSIRQAAQKLPEVLVAVSSSKTFGVYRERAGMAMVIAQADGQAQIAKSHIMTIARRTYSMSPFHGAGVIGHMLADADLNSQWRKEIDEARGRINDLRASLTEKLNTGQDTRDFSYIAKNQGMFSILGLSKDQAVQMRKDAGVYILNSSRINVAGLTRANIDTVVSAVHAVLN